MPAAKLRASFCATARRQPRAFTGRAHNGARREPRLRGRAEPLGHVVQPRQELLAAGPSPPADVHRAGCARRPPPDPRRGMRERRLSPPRHRPRHPPRRPESHPVQESRGNRQGWAGLAAAIRQAQHGNATQLSPPRATSDRAPGIAGSGLTVECQDFPTTINRFAGLHALGALVRARDPLTGGLSQSYEIAAQCVGWPLTAHNPPHRLHMSSQIPPILMVNATHDPSTAYVWAKVLRRQLPTAFCSPAAATDTPPT
jgi:hypothetical protein